MKISELLSLDRINLSLNATERGATIDELCQLMNHNDVLNDEKMYKQAILKREEEFSTAIVPEIAIPHAKSSSVNRAALALGISKSGVAYSDDDTAPPTKLFFMIAAPDNANNEHLETLAALSVLLMDENFKDELLSATSKEEVLTIINRHEESKQAKKAETVISQAEDDEKPLVVAVTACPTGIAHTYMAEEALLKKAKEMGVAIRVETNGTEGVKNKLTKEEIERASGVILAINRSVETQRFDGKPLIQVEADAAIKNPQELIEKAVSGDLLIYHKKDDGENASSTKERGGFYKHLMNGTSYMLPFVVSGGVLIALAFLFDTLAGVRGAGLGSTTPIAQMLNLIGGSAFSLFIPVLGAYVAYSIADRAALTAGFVGGWLASQSGAGFLGALIAGFLAGYLSKGFQYLFRKTPKSINGVKSILIMPIVTVLSTGLIMVLVVNPPVQFINEALINWLNNMHGGSKFVLGALLAGMMAVDMGGPINKAAYLFATGTLASTMQSGGSDVMAAVMAGGMVPPLGIALATTFYKKVFTKEEQEAGISNYIMGLSFITEGAIPFAASDPLRVLPASVIGSAVAGLLTMVFNIKLPAPHGGLLVMFLSNHFFLYLLAIAIGSVITAILLSIFKSIGKTEISELKE